jgi:hypothetical protein
VNKGGRTNPTFETRSRVPELGRGSFGLLVDHLGLTLAVSRRNHLLIPNARYQHPLHINYPKANTRTNGRRGKTDPWGRQKREERSAKRSS